MSMIDYFFSNQYGNIQYLFKDLSISRENHIMPQQGQYPVISLNFGDMKSGNCEFIKDQIKMKIWQAYLVFKKQMIESNLLDISEKNFIESVTYQMSDGFAINSIQCLCSFLSKIYVNRAAIVLLDNYDSIFSQNLSLNEFGELNNFFMNFISSTFKDNKFMLKGLLTGVMNISFWPNFNVYTVLSVKYSNCFGFTNDEITKLIYYFKSNSKSDDFKKWYSGYSFGNRSEENIFNPYSVSNFFNKNFYFSNYWFQSSGNIDFINDVIFHSSLDIIDCLIRLIQRKSIQKELKENIMIKCGNNKKEESILALFLSFGYLTVKKEEFSVESSRMIYTLKMPNEEVIVSFSELIDEWFKSNNFCLNDFLKAIFNNNEFQIDLFINRFVDRISQLYDSCQNFPEITYHLLALGLVACARKSFKIYLNNQSEDGSIYILMKSSNINQNSNSFIFEFNKKCSSGMNILANSSHFNTLKNAFINNLVEEGFKKENIKEFCFDFNENECKLNNNNNNDTHGKNESINKINQITENDNNNFDHHIVNSSDNDNQNTESNSNKSLQELEKIPEYEFADKPFDENEKVYVIDKNGYDIYEAVIIKKDKNYFLVHYPDYPDDDERIYNKTRILKKTFQNMQIFVAQEKLRNQNEDNN